MFNLKFSKTAKLAACLIAALFCASMEVATVSMLVKAESIRGWPQASGKIDSSEVLERLTGVPEFEGRVDYSFEVDGVKRNSQSVRVRGTTNKHRFDAESVVQRYPAGAAVTVFYNPTNPAESYLEAGADWVNYLLIVSPLVFMGIAVMQFFAIRKQPGVPPMPIEISPDKVE